MRYDGSQTPPTGDGGGTSSAPSMPPGAGRTAVAGLVARARSAPAPVIALTDEELAGLDGGPQARPVAPQPWLDRQDEGNRELICQVALRGLAARGIVLPDPDPSQRSVVAIHEDLRAVLVMRRSARAIVLAQRHTGTEYHTRMLYLHDDHAVLEDDISAGGLHGLTVMTTATAIQRLAELADPSSAAGRTPAGQPRLAKLADIAAGTGVPGIEDAQFVTTVGHLGPGEANKAAEQRLTVYALRDRVLLAEPLTTEGQPGLNITDVSARDLRQRLGELADIQEDA